MSDKPSVVLVHGAFADASGWSHVILDLEKRGFFVTAVQNPLTSLADDVATTRRVIDAQKGPVVLVGHSYGGAVITNAAKGARNVKALVYVAAFAPEENEAFMPLLEKYPSMIGAALVPDSAGFLSIDRAKFKEVFCADVNDDVRRVLAATQKPLHGSIFGAQFGPPAWKDIPSWFLVPKQDNVINPDLERMFAKRMNATTHEVESSHVPFISKPGVVVDLIDAAATATVTQAA
jgi:pimeloyl-ACP methyl ester carboxylesterase